MKIPDKPRMRLLQWNVKVIFKLQNPQRNRIGQSSEKLRVVKPYGGKNKDEEGLCNLWEKGAVLLLAFRSIPPVLKLLACVLSLLSLATPSHNFLLTWSRNFWSFQPNDPTLRSGIFQFWNTSNLVKCISPDGNDVFPKMSANIGCHQEIIEYLTEILILYRISRSLIVALVIF